jgi:hypothetical protein
MAFAPFVIRRTDAGGVPGGRASAADGRRGAGNCPRRIDIDVRAIITIPTDKLNIFRPRTGDAGAPAGGAHCPSSL